MKRYCITFKGALFIDAKSREEAHKELAKFLHHSDVISKEAERMDGYVFGYEVVTEDDNEEQKNSS